MLKLKLQYFGNLMQRTDSLEKTLILGKIEGRRRREQQIVRWHHWLNGDEFGRPYKTEEPGMPQSMGSQRVRHNLVTEQQRKHLDSGSQKSESSFICHSTNTYWRPLMYQFLCSMLRIQEKIDLVLGFKHEIQMWMENDHNAQCWVHSMRLIGCFLNV